MAEEWASPALLSALLLLHGCDASDSYDEFTSCRMHVAGLHVEARELP